MKFFFLILMVLVSCTGITAQNSFGVRMAYNNTNSTDASAYATTKSLHRFQAGVFGKLYLDKSWYLKANMIYDQKGNFYDDTYIVPDGGKKVKIKLNYIAVALDAGYSFRINEKQNIHIGLGPYLAYGINGTEKGYGGSITGQPIKIDRQVDFISGGTKGGTGLEIKKIDAGLNFNAEYQYKNYGLFINYGLGLASRALYVRSFNRVASVGLSYCFTLTRSEKGCFTE